MLLFEKMKTHRFLTSCINDLPVWFVCYIPCFV